MESLRKIPGPDANLPGFVHDRMVALGMKPTLSQLALATGVNVVTLQRNFKGDRSMKLSTAYKLKLGLKLKRLDDLIEACPFLVKDDE